MDMIVKEKEFNIQTSEDFVETMFGISSKDSAHILNILRDKLYSDKILAVIREYTTNAQDAHNESNIDRPIEVFLPGQIDPSFKVRDFGPGLSEEDIRNIYVMYGASTKRNTNKAVGQLGLGCKSAFCYTDKFNITSWYNGEKKIYCAYIDSTGVGKIALLSKETSAEQEGIEIYIPVKQQDFYNFQYKTENFLRFFQPQPLLVGGTITKLETPTMEGVLKNNIRFTVSFSKNTNRYIDNSYVVMGGISYPIAPSLIKDMPKGKLDLGVLLRKNLCLYVNIGDLEIAAHRESLEYTESTTKFLQNCILETETIIYDTYIKELKETKTLREANELYKRRDEIPVLNNINFTHPTLDTQQIDGCMLPENQDVFKYYCGKKHRNSIKWISPWGSKVVYNEDTLYILTEEESSTWSKKLNQYINYNCIEFDKIIVIKPKHSLQDKATQELWKLRKLDEYNFLKMSDCVVSKEEIKKITNSKKTTYNQTKNTHHVGNIFKLKPTSQLNYQDKQQKSINWEKITVVPKNTKYFVVLDSFNVLDHKNQKMNIADFSHFLNIGGLINYSFEIYGVKKSYLQKIEKDSTWVSFFDALKDKILTSSLVENIKKEDIVKNLSEELKLISSYTSLFPENSIAKKLTYEIQRLKEAKIDYSYPISNSRIKFIMRDLGIDLNHNDINEPILKLVEEAKIKYPLTATLDIFPTCTENYLYRRNVNIDNVIPHLVEYVKMIENKGESK